MCCGARSKMVTTKELHLHYSNEKIMQYFEQQNYNLNSSDGVLGFNNKPLIIQESRHEASKCYKSYQRK